MITQISYGNAYLADGESQIVGTLIEWDASGNSELPALLFPKTSNSKLRMEASSPVPAVITQ